MLTSYSDFRNCRILLCRLGGSLSCGSLGSGSCGLSGISGLLACTETGKVVWIGGRSLVVLHYRAATAGLRSYVSTSYADHYHEGSKAPCGLLDEVGSLADTANLVVG